MNTIIYKPLVTEKAMAGTKQNRYGFMVNRDATKDQIKHAVQTMFKVTVLSVATVTTQGKTKRAGKKRMVVTRPSVKKALVKIKAGQTIDIVPTAPKEQVS